MKTRSLFIIICFFGFGVVGNADIGFKAPSVEGTANVGTPELGAMVFDTSTNLFWGNNGSPTSPNWIMLSSPTQFYASGYFDTSYTWTMTTTGGSFYPFSNSTSGTFHVENQSSVTVTEPSGHGMGITFTPASTSAVYKISFKSSCSSGNGFTVRLYDSGNSIDVDETTFGSAGEVALSGVYVPGTTSPVTVLVQGAVLSSSVSCGSNTYGRSNATWDIQQVE